MSDRRLRHRGVQWDQPAAFSAALDDVTRWDPDGIRYLDPDLVLLMKASHPRQIDERDFKAAAPLLEEARRSRLRDYLEGHHLEHAWLKELRLDH